MEKIAGTPHQEARRGAPWTPEFGSARADLVSQDDVCDLELTTTEELALLDSAVSVYLADFYSHSHIAKHLPDFTAACSPLRDPRLARLDPGIGNGDESRPPSPPYRPSCGLDDGSECVPNGDEVVTSAKIRWHFGSEGVPEGDEVVTSAKFGSHFGVDHTTRSLKFADALHGGRAFREVTDESSPFSARSVIGSPGASLEETEQTDWEDASVFDEQAAVPLSERASTEAVLPDDDLPAVFDELAGGDGGPAPRRPALLAGAGAGPPPRRLAMSRMSEQAIWHSTMPTSEDCPDQVISFEPMYDEWELDLMDASGQDPVHRATHPRPCRQAPRKAMAGALRCDAAPCGMYGA